jgi:tRNA(Ile)-lysidine synthase
MKNTLSLDHFYEQLCSLSGSLPPRHHTYLIAYSGGLDSHVLLHLMVAIANQYPHINIRSLYIDHGLQDVSKDWISHCEKITENLKIPHQSVQLDLVIPAGESLEAFARKARYQVFQNNLHDDETLLTAHHQDDQAETLLLQLLRGSGLDGLAAMPAEAAFAEGRHGRPLLEYSRDELEAYADKYQLDYITDPSNQDSRFDRNYLRNTIVPLLKQRWPQMAKTLSRSAKLQAEAGSLLDNYCEQGLATLSGSQKYTLSADAIKQLTPVQQKAMLRYWIKQSGFKAPSAVNLQHILTDVLDSPLDSSPLVRWQGTEIRRYKDDLYLGSTSQPIQSQKRTIWDLNKSLKLDDGQLLEANELGELKTILLQQGIPVTVRYRQGGERIRAENKQHSISLKKLFQQQGIPPWKRQSHPLIYANDQLIAVLGLVKINKTDLNI